MQIVQGPSLREVFRDLMDSMHDLPLPPYELAEFLRLVGHEEIQGAEVPDDDLPILIAQLRQFLSKSTGELQEILRSLQAQEWPPVPASPLGPALEASVSQNEPSAPPAFCVASFHDPPGRDG